MFNTFFRSNTELTHTFHSQSLDYLRKLSVFIFKYYIDLSSKFREIFLLNITNTILDIIHRPVSHLKHNVSKNGFCLRLQAEPIQLGPIVLQTLLVLLWVSRDRD
jgi:hypothetical protein